MGWKTLKNFAKDNISIIKKKKIQLQEQSRLAKYL